MIRFRNTCKAFDEGAQICIQEEEGGLRIAWHKDVYNAELMVDFINEKFEITDSSDIMLSR